MKDLSTSYMGLELRSPVIVGSSGLTKSIDNLVKIDEKKVGAVVLKSLFEEQIKQEIRKVFSYEDVKSSYTEADDYIRNYARTHTLNEYIDLVHEAKKRVSMPVIASVNCVSANEWPAFAREIEAAGADALELNVFLLPADINIEGKAVEQIYFDIIENTRKYVKMPIALKISYHFSGLAEMVKKLSWTGINGLVLFNRFFNPDIDVEKFSIIASNLYSKPEEISTSLRWIAIMAGKVHCDLCASTGVHSGIDVIKQILAGANAVQVCSVLYKNGFDHLDLMHQEMIDWMTRHQYDRLEQFRGKMSHKNSDTPSAYHRVQFMKHFAGVE